MKVKTEIISIDSIGFREANERKHPESNIKVIRSNMERNGIGRSILVDENNQSIAGQGATTAARQAGITEVLVVEPAPNQLVAVRRTDLSEEQKAEMSVVDNLASDSSHFDPVQLKEMEARLLEEAKVPKEIYADALKRAERLSRGTFDYLNQKNDDEEGDGEDDPPDAGGQAPTTPEPPKPQERFPLPIVLDGVTMRTWIDEKKRLGTNSDTDAFKMMLAAVTGTDYKMVKDS